MTDNLSIRAAGPADLDAAAALTAAYPYKRLQQRLQGMDRTRLQEFFREGLRRGLESGRPHWLALEGERPAALAGLAEATWHSGIYGMTMMRVEPWLNVERPEAGARLLDEVEAAARARGAEHLSLRIDGADFANLHLLEGRGWRTVDVSLKFSRPMEVPFVVEVRPELVLGLATPDDAEWIRRIGSETHGGTHYLNDPALPAERTRELFARWIDRCLEGLAYRVYTVRDAASGAGLGFVIYLRNESFARAVGRRPIILDFVLLAPECRGRGIGAWLISGSLAREAESGFDFCELRTSAHNLAAVTCYESVGFLCCASDFALHKRLV